MHVDRRQRRFAVATLLATAVAAGIWWRARGDPLAPLSGGRGSGLAFGLAAAACMLIAIALTLRKRLSTWPLGRTRHWLAAHVWLSALTLPLVLFHGDFRLGGGVTSALMGLFLLSWLSGVVGVALQHWLPRVMTEQTPRETIYEQIDHVAAVLRAEAKTLIEKACGPHPAAAPLRDFYVAHVEPWLAAPRPRAALWDARSTAPLQKAHLKRLLPTELHEPVEDLFDLVDERHQLERQRRLHHWLHGWLLFHVPVSWATVAVTIWHALIAWRYQ